MPKTALQELIDYMDNHSMSNTGTYRRAKQLLELEREIIQDAYDEGWLKGKDKNYDSASKYFNYTFSK